MVPNFTAFQNISTFDGSSAFRLKKQARSEASWRTASDDMRIPLGGALGIRYLLVSDPVTAAAIDRHEAARTLYPVQPSEGGGSVGPLPLHVLENLVTLQPLQPVYDWLTASDDQDAFATLRSSGLMPNRQVVISPGVSGSRVGTLPLPGSSTEHREDQEAVSTIAILEQGSDRLELEIDSPLPGLLVRSEFPYPGWRVSVNGHRQPIHAANVVLQAVEIPAGRSRIIFRFRPHIYIWGGIITIFCLIWFAVPLFHRYIQK
jgi:hypothetical protein